MRRALAVVTVIGVVVALAGWSSRAQIAKPIAVDDREMYAVYASLLQREWIVRVAKATNLVVQEETATNWGCMPSGKPMETDWKPVLDDFRSANAGSHVLLAGQELGLPYQVVARATIAASIDRPIPNGVSDGWQGFRRRFPDSGGFLQMSVVGFDSTRQRAMVYVAHSCGGLCGGGTHHLLERDGTRWREAKVPDLVQCVWAS